MLAVPLVQVSWDLLAWQVCYIYTRCQCALSSKHELYLDTAESTTWQRFLSPLGLHREMSKRLFLKQQIPSYQVQKHFGCMVCATISACVLLSCLGLISFYQSCRVTFVGLEYHSASRPATDTWLPAPSAAFQSNTLTQCHGEKACALTIPRDMKSPISFYFNIGPFYENYLDFVKTSNYANSSFASGIAYRSFFNDTFEIKEVRMSEENIAWPTDIEFVNDLDESVSSLFASLDIAKQHMAVWMRPSAFPECFKLYGKIEHALSQNDTLTIFIEDRYPTADFHKRIWITDWQSDSAGTFWANWLLAGAALALLATLLLGYISYVEKDNTEKAYFYGICCAAPDSSFQLLPS